MKDNERDGRVREGVKREGGADELSFPEKRGLLERGALFERGGLIEDLLYCIRSTAEPFILPPFYYSLFDLSW